MSFTFSRQGGLLKYKDNSSGFVKGYNLATLNVRVSGSSVLFPDGNSYAYNDAEMTNTFASVEAFLDQIGTWKSEGQGKGLDTITNFVFVSSVSDLPAAVAGVITLAAETTYFFTQDVDLVGSRLVGSSDTVILGASSENATITSTGLGTGLSNALFTTEWTTPIRHVTFGNVDTAINIDGVTNAPVALDWTGVNFLNVPNVGQISTCDNWIFSKGAFLNSQGFVFTGTVGTIGIDNSIFVGNGSAGNIFEINASATITRRFRIIYSSIVAFGSTVGINVSTSATVPTEGYILDTINFSGGGTYTTGVDYLDNKVRWSDVRGLVNTAEFGNYYMTNNATITPIAVSGTAYKILGTTTENAINQKFTHSNNRLTYTGGLDRNFQVSATVSFTSGNNKVIGLYIAKNGSIVTSSEMYATTSGSGRAESIHVQTVLELTANDYIELWIENDTDTTDITVEFLNLICKSL